MPRIRRRFLLDLAEIGVYRLSGIPPCAARIPFPTRLPGHPTWRCVAQCFFERPGQSRMAGPESNAKQAGLKTCLTASWQLATTIGRF
jgi:hypothetical protein